MNLSPLHLCLLFSSALFCVGLIGALSRGNTILVLLGVELMLNAGNINLIAFWRYGPSPAAGTGVMFVIFSIAVAAAEAAVGLAIVIALFRHRESLNPEAFTSLKW